MKVQRIISGITRLICFFLFFGISVGMSSYTLGQQPDGCEDADAILEKYPVDTVLREVECFIDRIKYGVFNRLRAIIDPANSKKIGKNIFQQLEELETFRQEKIKEIDEGGLVQEGLPIVVEALEKKIECLRGIEPIKTYEKIINKISADKEKLENKRITDIDILLTNLNNLGDAVEKSLSFYDTTKVLLSEAEQRQEIKNEFINDEIQKWQIDEIPKYCPTPTPTPIPTPTPTPTPTPVPTPTPTPTPTLPPLPPVPTPNAEVIREHLGGDNQLTIHVGERLIIIEEKQGWFWVTSQTGRTAWVPANCVKLLELTPTPTPALSPTLQDPRQKDIETIRQWYPEAKIAIFNETREVLALVKELERSSRGIIYSAYTVQKTPKVVKSDEIEIIYDPSPEE